MEPTQKPKNRYGCWVALFTGSIERRGRSICKLKDMEDPRCQGCCRHPYAFYQTVTEDIVRVQHSWSERWNKARVYGGSKI